LDYNEGSKKFYIKNNCPQPDSRFNVATEVKFKNKYFTSLNLLD